MTEETDHVRCRPAETWEEVRRTAVTAGRAFEGRRAEGRFFPARIVDAPGLPLENTHLLEVEERLAGALQIYERQMDVGVGTVTVGAIGNVHVLPEYRGQGLSRRLLESAQSFVADRGYALTILGAGIPDLYENAGWTPLPHEETVVTAPEPVQGPVASSRLRPYRHDADCDAIARVYREAAAGVTGRFRRPPWLWRGWTLAPETRVFDPDQLRVYEEAGSVNGYLAVDATDSGAECLEIAYAGGDEATFQRTCWNAVVGDVEQVTWHPPLPPEASTAEASIETHVDDHVMVRVTDWATLSSLADGGIDDVDSLVAAITDGPWYWSELDAF